ncbi:hypothetical protein [Spirosoma endbachense]|uniref:Lipoprotein n=1 Tax=Spirosoma endbachense TaxID=2666025 RepID=A0A6P1VMS1_9BACT|nr:hypothetical protein [Spirosoma endbachense]QHV94581.1 hypothetical protein GJR95_05920 [Spirosoma endbachense]
MKTTYYCVFFLLIGAGCARQPTLSANSPFNVTSKLNDSTWYGTGQLLRVKESIQRPDDGRQLNLLVYTDIDYPGMGSEPNPNTTTGCLNGDCTRTQILMIYNIPFKKGRTTLAKLNKRSPNEQANLSYVGNSGGLAKRYIDKGAEPNWIRVTKINQATGVVEGRFALSFKEDMTVYNRLENGMPATAQFTGGLFRIKVKDVIMK